MPKDVVNEIFKLTRYGGGELLVETLKSIAEHSHIVFQKYKNIPCASRILCSNTNGTRMLTKSIRMFNSFEMRFDNKKI